MTDIVNALLTLRPNAKWFMNGDEYEGLVWEDEIQSKPTKEEILAEVEKLKQKWIDEEYRRKRAPEYPRLEDQLDALFHAGVFPPEMAAQIQAVKDKYPKG
mgnify:FL=1